MSVNLKNGGQLKQYYYLANSAKSVNSMQLQILTLLVSTELFKFSNLYYYIYLYTNPTYLQYSLSFFPISCYVHNIFRFILSRQFHMFEHLWVKGPFLSLSQDSGTPSHQALVTHCLYQHSSQKPSFLNSILSIKLLLGFDSCFSLFL